jgi:hypothetical protein
MRHKRQFVLITGLVAGALAGVISACSSEAEPLPDPMQAAATATAAVTPQVEPTIDVTAPTPLVNIEVRGVVGAVDVAARTIDIRPTGDAKFDRIIVAPATAIKTAGGPTIRLEDVRPADRIIAFGRPGDDPDVLLSSDITIQAVVPGSQPGG